jgi:hypothetical protein
LLPWLEIIEGELFGGVLPGEFTGAGFANVERQFGNANNIFTDIESAGAPFGGFSSAGMQRLMQHERTSAWKAEGIAGPSDEIEFRLVFELLAPLVN